jgi:hypothetical protein
MPTGKFGVRAVGDTYVHPFNSARLAKAYAQEHANITQSPFIVLGGRSGSVTVYPKKQKNPSSKIPIGKFIPARLNPDGTVTFKVYKKRKAAKKRAAKKTTRRKAAKKRK